MRSFRILSVALFAGLLGHAIGHGPHGLASVVALVSSLIGLLLALAMALGKR